MSSTVEDITEHRRKKNRMTNHDQALELLRNQHKGVTAAIDAIDEGLADLAKTRENHVALAVQLTDIIALVEQMDELGLRGDELGEQRLYHVTTADNRIRDIHAVDEGDARRLVKLAFPDLGILRVVTA